MSQVSAQRAAWMVVFAGGVAALQVGKLPPALPALQAELGLTLVQSGFLLSMVQLAGMSLAVFMGLLADGQANLSRITSSTAWWVQTDAPEGMKLLMRRGLEKSMEGDFETDSMRYKATERYTVGWTDPRGLYGTAGV